MLTSFAGVTVKGGETLAADLVIDASGRRSKVLWDGQLPREGLHGVNG